MNDIDGFLEWFRMGIHTESAENELVKIGPPSARHLLEALPKENKHTREHIIRVLIRICKEHPSSRISQKIIPKLVELLCCEKLNTTLSSLIDEIGKPVIPELVRIIEKECKKSQSEHLCFLLYKLGLIADEDQLPCFIDALSCPITMARTEAVRGISEILIKYPENKSILLSVPVLIAALEEGDPVLCSEIADLLGQIKDQRAVPALVFHLNDDDQNVRECTQFALVSIIGDVKTEEQLEHVRSLVQASFNQLKKNADETKSGGIRMGLALLNISIADKKNSLASKRDLILDDIPKPPKKGGIFKGIELKRRISRK